MNLSELENLSQLVIDGNLKALEAYVNLKKIEKIVSEQLKIIQPYAINEAELWHEKSFKFLDCTIEKRNSPSTWDYSNVNAYKTAKEHLKYIEKISQIGGGIDPTTGEEIEKAVKIDGKSTISVKI